MCVCMYVSLSLCVCLCVCVSVSVCAKENHLSVCYLCSTTIIIAIVQIMYIKINYTLWMRM